MPDHPCGNTQQRHFSHLDELPALCDVVRRAKAQLTVYTPSTVQTNQRTTALISSVQVDLQAVVCSSRKQVLCKHGCSVWLQ